MEAYWKIFTNCTSDPAARKVADHVWTLAKLEPRSVYAEPYHKGGYVVFGKVELEVSEWPQAVLLALQMAQSAGRAWTISGDIADELDAWSNESLVSGIRSLHVLVRR
jgi:hypothetical protein